MRYEVVFAGSGGQGLILSGSVFGEAAAILDRLFCVQAQNYGPESRGGMSESYVILSTDGPVDYPELTFADLVVALSQEGLERQRSHIKPETLILADEKLVSSTAEPVGQLIRIPMTEISTRVVGSAISANIVALGAVCAVSDKVSRASVEAVIQRRVPKGTAEKNLQAFAAGFEAARTAVRN